MEELIFERKFRMWGDGGLIFLVYVTVSYSNDKKIKLQFDNFTRIAHEEKCGIRTRGMSWENVFEGKW